MKENDESTRFDQLKDAEDIHTALQNKDISDIVEIICSRTNDQRQQIKETYISQFGTDLKKEIDSKLSSNVKELILGCLLTPEDFDSTEINKAIRGAGTNEDLLSEIIATRPSRHLYQVKQRYPELFNEPLDKAISGDTSGYYEKY